MSHVIKRDIFWKHREGKGRREGRENERRDERQSDELSKRFMNRFQVTFSFVLQIGPFVQ